MKGIDIGRKLSLSDVDYLRERGYQFVGRYYDGSRGANAKALATFEIAYLHGKGLGVVSIFERASNFPGYFTYAQGVADGTAAREDGVNAGQDLGTPIYFAVDFDVTDPQSQLVDYFNGVYAGLQGAYTMGVYGEYDVVKHVTENFPAVTRIFQTYAWSGGRVYQSDIYQHANSVTLRPGFVVDIDFAPSQPGW